MPDHGLGKVSQLAWVTRDIEASLAFFSEELGVGPWFVLPKAILPNVRHRGEPSDVELIVAFASSSGLEFEMMQQTNEAPSIWTSLPRGDVREALHHNCIRTDDYEGSVRDAAQAGYAVVLDGRTSRGRFAYVQRPGSDSYIELLEMSQSRRAMYEFVRDAGQAWDGSDPVRTMPAL